MLRCGILQFSTAVKHAAFVIVVLAVTARAAFSQPTTGGAVVSGTFSADPDTHWSLAGSVGYRFTRVLSLGAEVTWSRLKDVPPSFGPPYYASALGNPTRELVSFTTNIRADLHQFHRVVPFVIGGGGVAADSVARDIGGASAQDSFRIVDAATFLGLVVGAGASVLATRHVSLDGELKLLYMRGHNGQWARLGVGASYRF
jgi:opacity protein-like surface antigen